MRLIERIAIAFRATYEPGVEDPWYQDNGAHLLLGFLIAANIDLIAAPPVFVPVLIVLLLSVVWELFEYLHNIRPWDEREREDYPMDRAMEDTLLDIYTALTGATMAALLL